MADQTADADAGDRPGVGVERASESESRRRDPRRAVTDGGVSEVEHVEIDPTELEPHPKNREIYGEDPDLDGLVTDMEVDGYDPGSPLTINDEETVVKGHRRWKAAVEAGIEAVPVIEQEFESKDDEEAALLLDNLLQRDQSFSQKMREAAELERINDAENADTGVRGEVVEKFLESGEGRTRDRVAEAVGLGSGETYRRAKRVWEAAEDGDEEAIEQVERIDEGEQSIHGAFTALQDDPEPESGGEAAEGGGDEADADDVDEESGGPGEAGDPSDVDPGDDEGGGETPESIPDDTPSTDGSSDGDGVDSGGTADADAEAEVEAPDVTDENPPSPAELDDRDDPADEMGMGRSEGGGVGEDAGKPTDAGTEVPESRQPDEDLDDRDPSIGDEGDESPGDSEASGGEDGLVIDGAVAERVRERAEENDTTPEEMVDSLIEDGTGADDGGDESDDAGDDDTEGVTVDLGENEDEVRSRANELDLEPEEVVNRLVDAWVEGDDAPFESAP